MSSFDLAIPTILLHEGLFSDDKKDPGGATKYGISLRYLLARKSVNTAHLSSDINSDGIIDVRDIEALTEDKAKQFYKEIWDKQNYSQIDNQQVATKLFDTAVNMGESQGNKIIQRAVWSQYGYKSILDDGMLGTQSFKSINTVNPNYLICAMRSEDAGIYRVILAHNDELAKFEAGWMKRAYE